MQESLAFYFKNWALLGLKFLWGNVTSQDCPEDVIGTCEKI